MSFNFKIGSLVSRINLAASHNRSCIIEKKSPIGFKILTLLLENHVIKNFVISKNNFIIFLCYGPKLSIVKNIKLLSKPSKRVFVSIYDLKSLLALNSCSLFVVSTNRGLMWGKDCLRLQCSGELLFSVNL